jgi:hypothetical protein
MSSVTQRQKSSAPVTREEDGAENLTQRYPVSDLVDNYSLDVGKRVVLVTGATGFVGCALVVALAERLCASHLGGRSSTAAAAHSSSSSSTGASTSTTRYASGRTAAEASAIPWADATSDSWCVRATARLSSDLQPLRQMLGPHLWYCVQVYYASLEEEQEVCESVGPCALKCILLSSSCAVNRWTTQEHVFHAAYTTLTSPASHLLCLCWIRDLYSLCFPIATHPHPHSLTQTHKHAHTLTNTQTHTNTPHKHNYIHNYTNTPTHPHTHTQTHTLRCVHCTHRTWRQ